MKLRYLILIKTDDMPMATINVNNVRCLSSVVR